MGVNFAFVVEFGEPYMNQHHLSRHIPAHRAGERWGEMTLQHQPTLGCEFDLLPDFEIARVIREHSPFHNHPLTPRGIPEFITQVTGELVERTLDKETLRQHYIVAASLVLFARHLLNLGIEEVSVSAFERLLRHPPHNIEKPLGLIFKASDGGDLVELNGAHLSSGGLLEVSEESEAGGPRFKTSDRVQATIEDALREVRAEISHGYRYALHFAFIGYHHVCLPIFNIRSSSETADLILSEELRVHRGRFFLQMPEFLSES